MEKSVEDLFLEFIKFEKRIKTLKNDINPILNRNLKISNIFFNNLAAYLSFIGSGPKALGELIYFLQKKMDKEKKREDQLFWQKYIESFLCNYEFLKNRQLKLEKYTDIYKKNWKKFISNQTYEPTESLKKILVAIKEALPYICEELEKIEILYRDYLIKKLTNKDIIEEVNIYIVISEAREIEEKFELLEKIHYN